MTVNANEPYSPFNREAVSSWMRQMPGSFKTWLQEQRETAIRGLRGADDLRLVGLFQGNLQVLDEILKIREEA